MAEPSITIPETGGTTAGSLFRETVETVLLVAITFLIVNAAVGRFSLDGPSMLPTLHRGEYVLVSRLAYKLHPPERGDVIVFQRPEGTRIKRIVGLPGETIEVRQGQVLIDGRVLPEPYVKNPASYSMDSRAIGPDEYFVLGDNRDESNDSHNYGPIAWGEIDGKAWLIYWPPRDWQVVPHYASPRALP